MHIHDLNFEVEKLESTEGVNSAQAATASLHKDWLRTLRALTLTPIQFYWLQLSVTAFGS